MNDATVVNAPRVETIKLSASKEKKTIDGKEVEIIKRPARVAKVTVNSVDFTTVTPEQIAAILGRMEILKIRAAARKANESKELPFKVDSEGKFLADQGEINCELTLTIDDFMPDEETEVSDEQREAMAKAFVGFLATAGKSEKAQANNLAILSVKQAARLAERDPREVSALKSNLESFRDNSSAEILEAHTDALTEVFERIEKATKIRGEGERDF